jgi:hypothetical protein
MDPTFETLRQQRDELYRDAREHPDSDADRMVQILLLSAMSSQQSADCDEHFGGAFARERRGHRRAQARRIRERREAEAAVAAGNPLQEEETAANDGGGQAQDLSAETRLGKIAEALESAKAAAESGKEMDPMQVYNKIAQIVGLRPNPGDEMYAAMHRSGN